jgi:hypothetical protein
MSTKANNQCVNGLKGVNTIRHAAAADTLLIIAKCPETAAREQRLARQLLLCRALPCEARHSKPTRTAGIVGRWSLGVQAAAPPM